MRAIKIPESATSEAEAWSLLHAGFLDGIVCAAAQLDDEKLAALEEQTLARTELLAGALPPPEKLPAAVGESVATRLREARELVGRNVAACRGARVWGASAELDSLQLHHTH